MTGVVKSALQNLQFLIDNLLYGPTKIDDFDSLIRILSLLSCDKVYPELIRCLLVAIAAQE